MSAAALEVLRPLITDRVQSLVAGRLLLGMRFFDKRALASGFTRAEVKLALLLVRIANPSEPFTEAEKGCLEGFSRSDGQCEIDAPTRESSAPNSENSAPVKKRKKLS